MSDKIFPVISAFFKNTGIAAQGVDETSFLILAGVVILFVILFFTFVLLAKNRKITLPGHCSPAFSRLESFSISHFPKPPAHWYSCPQSSRKRYPLPL